MVADQKAKHCSGCGVTKPFSDFARNKRRKGGLSGWCKECHRRDYAEKREARRQQQLEYKEARRAQLAAAQVVYQREHRAERSAYEREWYWKNLDRARLQAVRRTQKRRAAGAEPDMEYASILRRDPCSYCGASPERASEIDHIEAVRDGGSGHRSNLTAACGRCNKSKGTKPLLDFLLT